MEGRRATACDSAFVGAIVFLSFVAYVGELGFYSDDWDLLAKMAGARDTSFAGIFSSIDAPLVAMRPGQVAYFSLLFKAFGLDLPFFLITAFVIWRVPCCPLGGQRWDARRWARGANLTSTLVTVGAVVAFKLATARRFDSNTGLLPADRSLVRVGAAHRQRDRGTLGRGLPSRGRDTRVDSQADSSSATSEHRHPRRDLPL